LAVSPDGSHLYLGTFPNSLEMVDLDVAGDPLGATLRTFDTKLPPAGSSPYLQFVYTPTALYFRSNTPENANPFPLWPATVWLMFPNGEPIDFPKQYSTLHGRAFAHDPITATLNVASDERFSDAFTAKPLTQGIRILKTALSVVGNPPDPPTVLPAEAVDGKETLLLEIMSGTTVLLTRDLRGITDDITQPHSEIRDYWMAVSLLDATTIDASPVLPGLVEIKSKTGGDAPTNFSQTFTTALIPGQTTEAVNLDGHLQNQLAKMLFDIEVKSTVAFKTMRINVHVYHGNPATGGRLIKTLNESVAGNKVLLLIPGYGHQPAGLRESQIQMLSTYMLEYLQQATAVEVPPGVRPRQFMISASALLGGQGHLGQLQTTARTLVKLGINTINAFEWLGLEGVEIDRVLDAEGLKQRTIATVHPLHDWKGGPEHPPLDSYFDFYLKRVSADLDAWIRYKLAYMTQQNGGTAADLAVFWLTDEPTWFFPPMLDRIKGNPNHLNDFRIYLQSQGLLPTDVGHATWSTVDPIGQGGVISLEQRKLFFWSVRFFADAASKGHALVTAAIENIVDHPVNVIVNWNNWISPWYQASPRQKLDGNDNLGPDAGNGYFDWMTSGRLNAHNLWCDDHFFDSDAQYWSLYANVLRSAASLGSRTFGGFILMAHPQPQPIKLLQDDPVGASYKALSLIGHGAKAIDFFNFGPFWLLGIGWSDLKAVYAPIANATRLIGEAEHLLFPGVPVRGRIAILLPNQSPIWDVDNRPNVTKVYFRELFGLQFAMTHCGYTVDFVDAQDLIDDALTARAYALLFVTGPNLSLKAQEKIEQWVQTGGVSVFMPGAASMDEFNTPSTVIENLLGVKTGSWTPDRTVEGDPTATREGPMVTFSDSQYGSKLIPVGPLTPLKLTSATSLATFNTTDVVVSLNNHGSGQVYAFGFYAGWQYWNSPERDMFMPRHWGLPQRHLLRAIARRANVPRQTVSDVEGVEVCRLESADGVAIVLLNWTEAPVQLNLTVKENGGFTQVRSAQGAILTSTTVGTTITVNLNLEHVDVLMFEK
jgi:hypothetical protein